MAELGLFGGSGGAITLQIPAFWASSPKAWTLVTMCRVPHPLRSVLYREARGMDAI